MDLSQHKVDVYCKLLQVSDFSHTSLHCSLTHTTRGAIAHEIKLFRLLEFGPTQQQLWELLTSLPQFSNSQFDEVIWFAIYAAAS